MPRITAKKRNDKLTPREIRYIKLCAYGYSDPEIAVKLKISYSTVLNIGWITRQKTETSNRAHLVGWAYREGVLTC